MTKVPQICRLHGLSNNNDSYRSLQTMGKHKSIHDIEYYRYCLLVCSIYYHDYGYYGVD